MARVVVIDDYLEYAEMAAAPLRKAGYEVMPIVDPVDWERVLNFAPHVITFGMFRKREAFNRAIEGPADILGWKALVQAEQYPAIQVLPILVLGDGLEERDMPTIINYDGFLTLPSQIHEYVPRVRELARKVKSRRKISGYICPCCGSRLVFMNQPAKDLFCPRCHTSVAVVNDAEPPYLLYSPNGDGKTVRGNLDLLTPPPQVKC